MRLRLSNTETRSEIFGLTYQELIALLRQKGLLDFLVNSSLELGTSGLEGATGYREIDELRLLGLVRVDRKNFGLSYAYLTDAGRIVVNKIIYDMSLIEAEDAIR
jgi:hypothetical protein